MKNLKVFLNNEYHYSVDKKAYNKINGLYNSIDFLMRDLKTTDEHFEMILFGLEKFINTLCLLEVRSKN